MAHYTVESDLPWIELAGGMILEFVALSPTTGAEITGCSVANVAIYGENLSSSGVIERLIPTLTTIETEGLV